MKNTLLLMGIICILFSCKNKTDSNIAVNSTHENAKTPTLEGVWELVGYYNYVDNKINDSTRTNENRKQVKIYTKNKVMWSKKRVPDSTEWFAYGSYTIADNILTENLEYASKTMDKALEESPEFKYELIVTDSTFSQIEIDENNQRFYSENYKRIE